MDTPDDSNDQAEPSTFLDLCPWCECDVEPHYADGEHWAACTSCWARGPIEHNLADVCQSWNELAGKVRGFERVVEIVENAARVPA